VSGALVLFTRDLRVNDQRALSAAAREHEHVLPLFVLDDALLAGSAGAPNRRRFLRGCLTDLHESLSGRGAGLTVRRGEPVREAISLARRHGLTAIHMSSATALTPTGATPSSPPRVSAGGSICACPAASPPSSPGQSRRPGPITTACSRPTGVSGARWRETRRSSHLDD
jgi:hypothetical protein